MYLLTTSQVITVTSDGTLLPTTALVGRKYVQVQNLGEVIVYIGGTMLTADTTGAGGYQLHPYSTWRESYGYTVSVYARTQSNNCEVLVQEGK